MAKLHDDLKIRLADGDRAVLAPGVYDALTAALAEQAGFEALYLSGAMVAYSRLAGPDIGLMTMTETLDALSCITERTALPVIVDGDTGFGNAINVQRTVKLVEKAGAAVLQLEDQGFPKRCGHLRDKTVIPAAEMAGKIRAAVDARDGLLIMARTDALASEGLDAAMDRGEAYLEAGADLLFIEAPQDTDQMKQICDRFGSRVPLLANMVEGGRTPLLPVDELSDIGYRLVIFPGGTARFVMHQLGEYYASLREHGTSTPMKDRMLQFDAMQDLLRTDDFLARGRRYET